MKLQNRLPRVWRVLVIVLAAACAVLGASWPTAHAAGLPQASPIVMTARAGFDGYYKDGQWLPVRVTLENNGPDVHGQLQIVNPQAFGSTPVIVTRDLDLPTQSRREVFLYLSPEGFVSSLEVNFKNGAETLAAPLSLRLTQLSPADLLYGVLASSPSAFNALTDVDPFSGQAYLAQLETADLPGIGLAWQALDVLVASDVDTGALTPEQRAALHDWVEAGGRLLVMGGPGWQKTTAGLGDLLPLAPRGSQTLAQFAPLAAFAALPEAPTGEAVAAVGDLAPGALALASAGDLPLIAARQTGYGQVVFFAVDVAFAPLRNWDGVAEVFRKVLSIPLDRPSWASGMNNWSSAQSAVDALPNLQLPNPLLICGFLGLYLVIVGPLNYVVLRRLKRRELAWITIPVIVIGFSLVAYLAGYGLAGNQPTLHQLALVQAWPGSTRARLDEVVGVFSPRRASYDVEFAPGLLVRPLPGFTLPGSASLRIEQADQTRLFGVRTEIAAVQTFVAQGVVPAPQIDAALRLELIAGTARLLGTLTNQSDLTLLDAVLLAPGGVLRLGEFKPGETRNISLILTSGRASSMSPNSIAPFASAPNPASPAPPYYSSTYDTTIDDILGNSNYYSDREQYRRYSLLSSTINTYSGATGLGRGGGVYLTGWVEAVPAAANVLNTSFKTVDETAYLISLNTTLDFGTGAITIPPGLMTWAPLAVAKNSGALSPYDSTLYTGDQYAIRFTPIQPLTFGSVKELTLRLMGSSYGPTSSFNVAPRVELWDFVRGDWAVLDAVTYGDRPVEDPGRFVGSGGEIRVRLFNPSNDTISLSYVEFMLTVEP